MKAVFLVLLFLFAFGYALPSSTSYSTTTPAPSSDSVPSCRDVDKYYCEEIRRNNGCELELFNALCPRTCGAVCVVDPISPTPPASSSTSTDDYCEE